MRELTGRGLGVLALLAGCGLAATITPAAATGFTISGTVRSAQSGAGVGMVCVDARDATTGAQVSRATSAGDGTYVIDGMPAGSYRVFFDPQCISLSIPYTWQWWPGTADPNNAGTVVVQSDVPVIDAALQPGGSMNGTLTDPHGQPAAGVCVTIDDASRRYPQPTRATTSDASGHYSFDGLATTSYTVAFGGCDPTWSTESYPGIDGEPARPVAVSAPSDTGGVDATVARLTTLSGRLTSTTDGSPIPGTCIDAFDTTADSVRGGWYTATTATDGTYTIPNVNRGTYRVSFGTGVCLSPSTSPDIATTIYSATGDRTRPTDVKVDGDPVGGIDMALQVGGDITGHIVGPDGSPVSGITVWAHSTYATGDAHYLSYWSAQTDVSGNYTVAGLPNLAGLRIEFLDLRYQPTFANSWYDRKTTIFDATPVDVTAGHVTSGIDAQLHHGSELEGQVLDASGQPVAGATVHLLTESQPPGTLPPTAKTDSTGAWHADGLVAGIYRILAEAPGDRPDVSSRYLPSAADPAQAATVSVDGSDVAAGQNVQLGAAGHVAGRVTDSSGAALANVCVTVRDPRREVFAGSSGTATSDADGHYDVGGLNPGSYVVHLVPCPGLLAGSIYHGGAVVQSAATRVDVVSGGTTDVGTDQMPDGGDITGIVTSAGAPIGGYVTAESDDGERHTVRIATDGSYDISGLTAGDWRVHFQGCPYAHSTYYTNSDSASGATPVAVGAGRTTGGISADLTWLGTASEDSCHALPSAQSVVATPIDQSTVLVTWKRPADSPSGLTEYWVWDSPRAGFFQTTPVSADDTEELVTGIQPGQYTFSVDAIYWSGSVESTSQPVSVDSTPPAVALHLAGLTIGPRASASWQGSDPDGVRSYDVQWTHRTIAGTLAAWSAYPGGSGTTATTTTFAVPPGYVYCLRLRATDRLGNVSTWSPPVCTMHPVDDAAMHASSGWTVGHPTAAYLATVHAIKATGATMTVSVRHVTTLYLLTYVCPSCGSADVYIGRVRVGRLNLASSTAHWTQIRVTLGGSRSGVVTVRTTSARVVYVDGLGALDG